MKYFIKNNIIYIIIILLIVLGIIIIIQGVIYSNVVIKNNKIYKAKISLLQDISNKKSDIEILSDKALKSLKSSIDNMNNINSLKETIKKVNITYEHNILLNRCYKEQIARKINGVEYNIKYCDDDKNLESYRVKKQLR